MRSIDQPFSVASLTCLVVEVEVPGLAVGGGLDVVLGARDLEVVAERRRRRRSRGREVGAAQQQQLEQRTDGERKDQRARPRTPPRPRHRSRVGGRGGGRQMELATREGEGERERERQRRVIEWKLKLWVDAGCWLLADRRCRGRDAGFGAGQSTRRSTEVLSRKTRESDGQASRY